MTKKRGRDLMIGAVVGGVIGSVTALLFAPKSGKALRGDISMQAQRISSKTQEWAETAGTKTHDIVRAVQVHATDWVDRAKEVAYCMTKGQTDEQAAVIGDGDEEVTEEGDTSDKDVVIGVDAGEEVSATTV